MMFVSVSVSVFGQDDYAEEVPQEPNKELTKEEFNYLSKGLKVQEESGLDMKSGYELANISVREIGAYLFEGSVFIEKKDNLYKAISIKVSSKTTKKTLHYLTLPLYGNEYRQQYFDKIFYFDANLKQCVLIYTSNLFSQYFITTSELMRIKESKKEDVSLDKLKDKINGKL